MTASAPLAVINTAGKHLHNDLARAIKALEQKKDLASREGTDGKKNVIHVENTEGWMQCTRLVRT